MYKENIAYWKANLEEVFAKELELDTVRDVMGIAEIEREATSYIERKVHTENPLEKTVLLLEKEIDILKEFIKELCKVDDVDVENGRVKLTNRPI